MRIKSTALTHTPLLVVLLPVMAVAGACDDTKVERMPTPTVTADQSPNGGMATTLPNPPTQSPAATAGVGNRLSLDVLKNAEYLGGTGEERSPFTDGVRYRIRGPAEETAAAPVEPREDWKSELVLGSLAYGDLNSDGWDDAAIVITTRAGGTGNSSM